MHMTVFINCRILAGFCSALKLGKTCFVLLLNERSIAGKQGLDHSVRQPLTINILKF
jgi:hypothetical protein